jgi:hypothetical protein
LLAESLRVAHAAMAGSGASVRGLSLSVLAQHALSRHRHREFSLGSRASTLRNHRAAQQRFRSNTMTLADAAVF